MKPHMAFLTTFAASLALTSQGCASKCLIGTPQQQSTCGMSGGATLSAPAELGLGDKLSVSTGNNCLAEDGTCSVPPRVSLTNKGAAASMSVFLTLPVVAMGQFTLPLPSACDPVNPVCPAVDGVVISPTGMAGVLTLESGSIEIQRSTATDLDVTFALELQTETGQTISVTNGQASMKACHLETACAE
jgi:hypothetical protein